MADVIEGILNEDDMVLLDETVLLESLVECMKPFVKNLARKSGHPYFIEYFKRVDPDYLFSEEEIEKLSNVNFDVLLELYTNKDRTDLYNLISIYLDNSHAYTPYDTPKRSKTFNELIKTIRQCKGSYGEVADKLAIKLEMYKSLFIDPVGTRHKGTEYKRLSQNIKNLRNVHHCLNLLLNTTEREREQWLVF